MVLELHYWNIRGLGEPIRQMLEYLEVKYENKYKINIEDWLKEKNNIGIDLHNLPYIVDENVKLSQSFAIMKYLSRKYKQLQPKTEQQIQQVDIAEGLLVDLRFAFSLLCYNPKFEEMKDQFLEELPNKLKGLEDVLGKRNWMADDLTWIDFGVAEILDQIEICFPNCFQNLPNILKYKTTYENLPQIKSYKSSSRFKRFPVFSQFAYWGK